MKRKRQLSLLLITLIIIIGVCGCMSTNDTNRAEKIKDLALNYLNDKYDDTFKPQGYSNGDWAYEYSSVSFISEKYADSVEVQVTKSGDDYLFEDDYYKLTMKEETEKYFEKLVERNGYEVEVKVDFSGTEMPTDLDSNSTFTELTETGKCNIEVYFISLSVFTDDSITAVMNDIANAHIMGHFRFIQTDDSNLLAEYSISEIVDEKSGAILNKQSYSINKNYEIIQ